MPKPKGTTGCVQLHGHTVHHKHGVDVFVAATPDGAKRDLYNFVKEWWSEEIDEEDENGEPVRCPKDMDEAIERYFDTENGAYEEYAEECDPVFDQTEGMEAVIASDRFEKEHVLKIQFTHEGLIADFCTKKGKVVKTMSITYDELVESWLE